MLHLALKLREISTIWKMAFLLNFIPIHIRYCQLKKWLNYLNSSATTHVPCPYRPLCAWVTLAWLPIDFPLALSPKARRTRAPHNNYIFLSFWVLSLLLTWVFTLCRLTTIDLIDERANSPSLFDMEKYQNLMQSLEIEDSKSSNLYQRMEHLFSDENTDTFFFRLMLLQNFSPVI